MNPGLSGVARVPLIGNASVAGTLDFGALTEEEVLPYHVFRGSSNNIQNTIFIIIISALLFIAIVAIYEVLRVWLSNIYIDEALHKSNFTPEEIQRTKLSDEARLNSTMAFAVIAIISALIIIPLLIVIVLRK